MSRETEGSGVMLVRAWVHDGQLVARLQSSRTGDPDQHARVAVGLEQIHETVLRWLSDLEETQR
ncbi:hypothetical protein [Nocardioides sp. URHA0020]|uniref:hypothetical protein n=1 Tax=Nocardioides sp. URHA0020 TaxID=1380392 RepID=UPI00048EFE35|nr:hypothetical protein [Nocardioides sp. URHA0020]